MADGLLEALSGHKLRARLKTNAVNPRKSEGEEGSLSH